MVAIIDYGVGNLFSLKSSFRAIGEEAVVTGEPEVIRNADKLVLPGVGAFGDAAALLRKNGLDQVVCTEAAAGKPLLGICLGMQLLFDYGVEYGRHEGLGLIPGSVQPIRPVIPAAYKVPHIGWNGLHFPDCYGRIRPGADGGGGEGECVRRAVPSGEERERRAAYFEGVL